MSDVSGRWSNEEHERFLLGMELHGKKWTKVAEFVRTRTTVQVRSHAQKHFQKVGKPSDKDTTTEERPCQKRKLDIDILRKAIPAPPPLALHDEESQETESLDATGVVPLSMAPPLPVPKPNYEAEEDVLPPPPAHNPKMEITFSSMEVDEKMISALLRDDESIITARRSRDSRSRDSRGSSVDQKSRDGGSTDE